jgi:hypothetical protein
LLYHIAKTFFGRHKISEGQFDLALPLYQQALTIHPKRLGDNHVDTATSLNNLAELYRGKVSMSKLCHFTNKP